MQEDASLPAADRQCIRKYIHDGKQLIHSVDLRQSTIERIAEEIVVRQRDFLDHGAEQLRPLNIAQVADSLGLHETTISRAVANKYVLTPHGLFSFKHFFSTGYENEDGEALSSRAVKLKILSYIKQESPGKPLSDQKIVDLLAQDGIQIARRTVAKYREEENIPAASLRRLH
jgi:RNA polymerase sigma-54 factor